ncbi:ubiquinol-cytochrome C reductase complex 14kD subunit-domain-containing protein [Amanita rubescens]|nr:ubiquinol-cytochrome C reductase complex 14kD subunit-domain-containing protein [Amanita rubescens]
MPFGPFGLSLASYVRRSRTLYGWVKPIANWYANASGYRKYGFKYDDLLIEERADVQKALQRLTPQEQYDRSFRLKRASQASVLHAPLAKSEWTTTEEDIRYLKPHVLDVSKEESERKMWDTITVERK